ncbi:MAG: hypothetical protein WC758_03120 [Candidatus Woesearchaeota archaeon]|jgi:hypothetical protein
MKGQTQQVFIYIMVILVVGGVLLFGYKSINNIIGKSCDVDQVTFQTQLKQTLEKNSGYGDISTKPIKVPCGFDELCFVNSTDVDTSNLNQLIVQEIIAQTGNNVFLVNGNDVKALYGLDFLVVPGNNTNKGSLCIKSVGGNFNLVLEGIGKGKVKIT